MNFILTLLISISSVSVQAVGDPLRIEQDGVTITVTYEPTQCTVGDLINVHVHAQTDGTKQLTLDDEHAFGSFNVVGSQHVLDIPTASGREWDWSVQLDTFDASATEISGITLSWSDVHNNSGSISIGPLPIEIKSVAGASLEEMSLRDIKPPLPLLTKSWWFVAVLVGMGFLILFIAARFLRKKQIPISSHAQAMLDLQSLREANLDVLPFYTELSDIVRKYLEGRFNIKATGQTTREFLVASKNSPHLEGSDRQALSAFLVSADLVKFARLEPSHDVCDKAITQAEQFVSTTAPAPSEETMEVAA
ncbi:MAG: hypothetical protein H8E91_03515 [Planctomycetes bacterium]|nr:hypothetical protein [Planctomycetota bacterium]